MSYTLKREEPLVTDYINIRLASGLSRKSEEAARIGLAHSLFAVVVYSGTEPIGIVYYQKTRLTLKNCGSRGCSIVVVQHSAEFFSALDVTNLGQGRRGLDQLFSIP